MAAGDRCCAWMHRIAWAVSQSACPARDPSAAHRTGALTLCGRHPAAGIINIAVLTESTASLLDTRRLPACRVFASLRPPHGHTLRLINLTVLSLQHPGIWQETRARSARHAAMAGSRFNELALQYVLAVDKQAEATAASEAAALIQSSSNTRISVGQWVSSINRWISPDAGSADRMDDGSGLDQDLISRAKGRQPFFNV